MTDPEPDLSFEAATDAIAIISALMLMPSDEREKHSDESIEAIMEIVRGKTWLEVIALVVQLGGFAKEMLQVLCETRDLDPEEHLRKMAMDMHTRRLPEGD